MKALKLEAPLGEKKILMHSCCAPCSAPLMEKLKEEGFFLSVFFYNPNIHPLKEYELRKKENIRFCEKLDIPFYDADYDPKNWFKEVKGLELEPERGKRCTLCFDMRFHKTALYAVKNNFKVFTSSLGISRWKDMDQINRCGHKVASSYKNLFYWDYNWRKKGGSSRMYEIAKKEEFYQQQYCGCIYSLRDTNQWRVKQGRKAIEIGNDFYSELSLEKDSKPFSKT